MKWNAELYDGKHDYVPEYGKGLLQYIPDNQNQVILDVGCGTGSLTVELSKNASKIIGVDSSADMIQQAQNQYPHIDFIIMDAYHLTWENYFDIVFSNAVFHWIRNQDLLLTNIYHVLKSDGKLVCEFGGFGNISKIENAFKKATTKHAYDYTSPFYFPTNDEYNSLLKNHGFQVELIMNFDRPTPLSDGEIGLRNWLKQFFASDLLNFSEEVQNQIFSEIETTLKQELWDGRQWIADYKRIRAVAVK